jgi:cytosine/adenosine deaminase-related metal-dependent hydrolase
MPMTARKALFLLGLAAAAAPASLRADVVVGRILVKNGILFTLRADETAPQRGYLLAGEDGKILRVGYGDPPPGTRASQTLDATGKFVMPGFVSAHSHVYQAATRGLAVDQGLEGWFKAIAPYSVGAPPEDRYYETLFGCLDLLRHGITTAFNFNDANGQPNVDIEALKGELASGIRFVHGYCLPLKGTSESRLDDFDAFYAYTRKFSRKPNFLSFALGGYSCVAEDKGYTMLEGEIMAKYGLFNQAHYLEPAGAAQIDDQRARFEWFVESGELGPQLSFGHLVHADDAMLRRIAASGAAMVWNPMSNGRLASGFADIPKMKALGIRIGMGVDGQASADIADPFENMRMGLYVIRAKYESAKILQPIDVLRFHTMGSAEVLGVADKVGSLEVGKFADIIVVDPKLVERGPIVDPYAAVVLACNAMNLAKVYVGGDLLVDTYHLQKNDMSKVSSEVNQRVARLH